MIDRPGAIALCPTTWSYRLRIPALARRRRFRYGILPLARRAAGVCPDHGGSHAQGARRAAAEAGADLAGLLDVVRDVVARYNRHSAHPRFFGYVCSPGAPITAISQMIAAAMNINVTCWRSAPSGTEMELTVIRLDEGDARLPGRCRGRPGERRIHGQFRRRSLPPVAPRRRATWCATGLSGAPRMCVYVSRRGPFFHNQSGWDARHRRSERAPDQDR